MRLDKTTDHMHNQVMKYTQTFIYTYVLKCLLYFYNQNGVFRRGFFFRRVILPSHFSAPPPLPLPELYMLIVNGMVLFH